LSGLDVERAHEIVHLVVLVNDVALEAHTLSGMPLSVKTAYLLTSRQFVVSGSSDSSLWYFYGTPKSDSAHLSKLAREDRDDMMERLSTRNALYANALDRHHLPSRSGNGRVPHRRVHRQPPSRDLQR
jgi:hypothetical protein